MIKKSPERIFLNVGEEMDEEDTVNFPDLVEVSWSEERIFQDDIEYIRADLVLDFFKQLKDSNKVGKRLNKL